MGRARTRRKNALKRRRRRAFAEINAEIRAHEESRWTPEALELERMREEEARQRTHEQWCAAVDKSAREFDRRRRVQEERKELVRSIRQRVEQQKLGAKEQQTDQGGNARGIGRNDKAAAGDETDNEPRLLSNADAALLLAREAQARAYQAMLSVQMTGETTEQRSTHARSTLPACAFYSRTGACPFARSGCPRTHERVRSSRFLLLRHMFASQTQSGNIPKRESSSEAQRVTAFYTDVLAELERFGPLARMEILQNQARHLFGNVYAEFCSAESASKALQALRLRWYGGRQVDADLIPMSGLDAGVCGAFLKSRCARGNEACNYMHMHDVADAIRPQPMPRAGTSLTRKDHDIVVDYFERTAGRRGSDRNSRNEAGDSKKRPREEESSLISALHAVEASIRAEGVGQHRRSNHRDHSPRAHEKASRRPSYRERSSSRERHHRRGYSNRDRSDRDTTSPSRRHSRYDSPDSRDRRRSRHRHDPSPDRESRARRR